MNVGQQFIQQLQNNGINVENINFEDINPEMFDENDDFSEEITSESFVDRTSSSEEPDVSNKIKNCLLAARKTARNLLKDLTASNKKMRDGSLPEDEEFISLDTESENTVLNNRVFDQFAKSVLLLSSLPTNEGQAESTKFIKNYANTNKTLALLFSIISFSQGVILAEKYEIAEKIDFKINDVLNDEEIENLKAMFLASFNKNIEANHIKIGIHHLSVFLRNAAILFQALNFQPILTEESGSYTKDNLKALMSFCGMENYESLVSIFDCNGSASLAQYLDVYAKQVEKSPAQFSKITIKRYLDLEDVKLVALPDKYSDLAKIGADYKCENFINMMSTECRFYIFN